MESTKALEITNSLIAYIDVEKRRYLAVNDAYTRILGYEKDEIIGTDPFDIVHPADHDKIITILSKAMKNQSQEIRSESIETRLKDSNSQWHDFLTNASLQGKDLYIVSQDVTELRKRERELRDLKERDSYIIANIADGIYQVNLKGTIVFCNIGLSDMLGYHSKNDLIGKNYKMFTTPEDIPKIFQAFNKVHKTGKPVKDHAWKLERCDGQIIDVNTSITPMFEGDEMTGFYGTTKDMKIYNNNRDLTAMLETLGGLSHKINSPLMALFGYNHLLQGQTDPDDPRYEKLEMMEMILEQITDVMYQIRQIREYKTKSCPQGRMLDIPSSKIFL